MSRELREPSSIRGATRDLVHGVNNDLAKAQIGLDLLRESLALPPEMQTYLDKVDRSVQSAARRVNTFHRIVRSAPRDAEIDLGGPPTENETGHWVS